MVLESSSESQLTFVFAGDSYLSPRPFHAFLLLRLWSTICSGKSIEMPTSREACESVGNISSISHWYLYIYIYLPKIQSSKNEWNLRKQLMHISRCTLCYTINISKLQQTFPDWFPTLLSRTIQLHPNGTIVFFRRIKIVISDRKIHNSVLVLSVLFRMVGGNAWKMGRKIIEKNTICYTDGIRDSICVCVCTICIYSRGSRSAKVERVNNNERYTSVPR